MRRDAVRMLLLVGLILLAGGVVAQPASKIRPTSRSIRTASLLIKALSLTPGVGQRNKWTLTPLIPYTNSFQVRWRGGRAAEGNGLLNRHRAKSSVAGSNPALSATPWVPALNVNR